MDQYLFDSSALVKRYHAEPGSPAVDGILEAPGVLARISRLTFVEVQAALAVKTRTGSLSRTQAGVIRARFLMDVAAGELHVTQLNSDHFRLAERLIGKYGFSHRLRTLDALQLAVAKELADDGLLDYFVAADLILLNVAALEGLALINPDSHFRA